MARTPWWSCGALPGLAALCLVSRRSSASPESVSLRECEFVCILARVLHLGSHVPLPFRSKHRGTLRLSVIDIDLAARGEDGMVASAEEAESSASSASSDRPSAVFPIVALPRTPRTGLMRGEILFRISCIDTYEITIITTLTQADQSAARPGRALQDQAGRRKTSPAQGQCR